MPKIVTRPDQSEMFLSRWGYTSPHYPERGQISSGPGGLVSAVVQKRAGLAEGDLAWATVARHPSGELIFDSRTGLDDGPTCGQCTVQARCRCFTAGYRPYFMRTITHGDLTQAACICGWEGVGRWEYWWDINREFDSHTCLQKPAESAA